MRKIYVNNLKVEKIKKKRYFLPKLVKNCPNLGLFSCLNQHQISKPSQIDEAPQKAYRINV